MKFNFPKLKHKYPLSTREIELARIRVLPSVVEWAEEHFLLSSAYSQPGKFIAYHWQREPLNALLEYDTVIHYGCTRVFKSLAAEIQVFYCVDNIPMNAMFCYAKKDTVEDVFEDRIKPVVFDVPAINKYYTGREKDLTKRKIKLSHIYMRVASSEVRSDIATWDAGLIYASEVSKYRKKPGWEPIEALKRRQDSYSIIGRKKAIFESSPLLEGDILDQEVKRADVLRVFPMFQCPKCGMYQRLYYTQVKEIPNSKGDADHDPGRIRDEKAAFYECFGCRYHWNDADRLNAHAGIVWAASGEKIADGKVTERIKKAGIAYQYPRWVDPTFSFYECLARYFTARKKGIEAVQLFMNEDMGESWKPKTKRVDEGYLKTKCAGYLAGTRGDIPNDVLVLLCGIDTQKPGFYYVVNGYTQGMDKFLVAFGDVPAPEKNAESIVDPRILALDRIRKEIFEKVYLRRDGVQLEIYSGLIDRGGHRPEDVDYVVKNITELKSYIGETTVNFKAPLIKRSEAKNATWYLGQSQRLSKIVTEEIESDGWKLPDDVSQDYIDQVLNEWIEEIAQPLGGTRYTYVKKEPNHYRSCENMVRAAVALTNLEELLNDPSSVQTLTVKPTTITEVPELPDGVDPTKAQSEYFNRR